MKRLILLVVLLTLVAFVSGAMAQQKPAPAAPATAPAKPAGTAAPAKPAAMERFAGVIEKVDEMGKTISVKGKATVIMGGKITKEDRTFTFAITDETKISRAGKDLPFGELKKDMQVAVDYTKEGEKMTAAGIRAAAPKAMPKKEKPAEAPKK
jgi:hypothetical protein